MNHQPFAAYGDADDKQAKYLDSVMQDATGNQELFVVTRKKTIVAFAALRLDPKSGIGEIGLNAIDPQEQGQGIARLIYDFILDRLRGKQVNIIRVGTGLDSAH